MENSPIILTLKIDNSTPIPLSSFVKAFTSLAAEYENSLRDSVDFQNDNAEIFIKEVRSGSIIADLIPFAAATLPLVVSEADKIVVAVEFVRKWETRLKSLARGVIPDGASRSDL